MIIAIVGPTGVGKTKLSIELAKKYNGEIINADAMQIYKGLDIGTAKVTKEEMEGVTHHLLSIKDVLEDYSVFDYQKDARKKIEEIQRRGKTVIFVGGTGYYLKAALYDYEFLKEDNSREEDTNNLSKEELVEKIDSFGYTFNYDKDNTKRMKRILKRLENGFKPEEKKTTLLYPEVIFIGLTTDRDNLYKIINERFLKMVIPLIDEVKPFWLKNIKTKPLMTGIGYKEFYPFFENEKTLKEVIEECQKNSRHYAKRQYTWFLNQMEIEWFNVNYDNFLKTVEEVEKYIEARKK